MSSQRTWKRIAFWVVLFVLLLAASISLISTCPAAAAVFQKKDRLEELEALLAQSQEAQEMLLQNNAQLTALVEQLRAEAETRYILVLRHETHLLPSLFGNSICIGTRMQEIRVSKVFYDSCQIGDDITTSDHHRFLASGTLTGIRVIVADKLPH